MFTVKIVNPKGLLVAQNVSSTQVKWIEFFFFASVSRNVPRHLKVFRPSTAVISFWVRFSDQTRKAPHSSAILVHGLSQCEVEEHPRWVAALKKPIQKRQHEVCVNEFSAFWNITNLTYATTALSLDWNQYTHGVARTAKKQKKNSGAVQKNYSAVTNQPDYSCSIGSSSYRCDIISRRRMLSSASKRVSWKSY